VNNDKYLKTVVTGHIYVLE